MSPTIRAYTPQLSWDERAGYWVAELREIPTCSADGSTPAEAVSNLEATFAVLKEAYTEENTPLPVPEPALPVTIAAVQRMSELLNLSNLARKAGFSPQTLASKMKRQTEFTVEESRRIAAVLRELVEWSGASVAGQPASAFVHETSAKYGSRAVGSQTRPAAATRPRKRRA